MTLSPERQEALTAAYNENIADGNAPYTDATIRDNEELQWIFAQRQWSGAYFLPDHQSRANLSGADLSDADLSDANLSYANLRYADLSRADLRDADLRDANLSYANLSYANLRDANLSGADLSDADLSDANLRRADLSYANLRYADLSGADLRDADLRDANLSDANLSDANLRRANLSGADLRDADLRYANLSGADLSDANLRYADLSRADLDVIKYDIFAACDLSPLDVTYLYETLERGEVDGSTFGDGRACGCLIRTLEISSARRLNLASDDPAIAGSVVPRDTHTIAQRWFLGIHLGDTPETSSICRITHDWIGERLTFYHDVATMLAAQETHNSWPQIAEDLDAMNLQSATVEKIYTIELACPACSACLTVPQDPMLTVWTLQDMINNDDTVICPACDTKCILHRDAFTLK